MWLVDADALKNHLEDLRSYTILGEESLYYDGETNALSVAIQCIDNAPTVDTIPVKHGKWVWFKEIASFACSECHQYAWDNCANVMTGHYQYCPCCGAKMEVEVDDETD